MKYYFSEKILAKQHFYLTYFSDYLTLFKFNINRLIGLESIDNKNK